MKTLSHVEVEHLHQPDGWLSPAYLEIDDEGFIAQVLREHPDDWDPARTTRLHGFTVPGMPNVHSHAFQRAMVGLAERRDPAREDSFWTWREAMYEVASQVDPDTLEVIATQLYVEMLEAGMTSVGEFHYLHHQPDGSRFADPSELSRKILRAAEQAGIAISHLPVLYMAGGFGRAPEARQRRFTHDSVDEFLQLVQRILPAIPASSPHARLGIAPHSLRAVPEDALRQAVEGIKQLDPSAPVHIHIAEQAGEVRDCEASLGARPVSWLLSEMDVDETWCLIHATHVTPDEVRRIASSKAVVGLCPTTEANLGDGIFRAKELLEAGGRFAIGSDSQVCISVAEELRTLEYGQRLRFERRNVLFHPEAPSHSVGRSLFDECLRSGAQALNQPVGALTRGKRADLVVLDPAHPRLLGHGVDTVLDAWIFGGAQGAVRDVFVAGRQMVRDGRHFHRDGARDMYRSCWADRRSGM